MRVSMHMDTRVRKKGDVEIRVKYRSSDSKIFEIVAVRNHLQASEQEVGLPWRYKYKFNRLAKRKKIDDLNGFLDEVMEEYYGILSKEDAQ